MSNTPEKLTKTISPTDLENKFVSWVENEIVTAIQRLQEVGKFLFGASALTVGALISFSTLNNDASISFKAISYMLLIVSALLGMLATLPSERDMIGDDDLVALHHMSHQRLTRLVKWSFYLWVAGLSTFILIQTYSPEKKINQNPTDNSLKIITALSDISAELIKIEKSLQKANEIHLSDSKRIQIITEEVSQINKGINVKYKENSDHLDRHLSRVIKEIKKIN